MKAVSSHSNRKSGKEKKDNEVVGKYFKCNIKK